MLLTRHMLYLSYTISNLHWIFSLFLSTAESVGLEYDKALT